MLYLFFFSVWDSWAVPESGILEGNVKYTGHYHECKLYENKDFSGKYCLAYYGVFFIVIIDCFTLAYLLQI